MKLEPHPLGSYFSRTFSSPGRGTNAHKEFPICRRSIISSKVGPLLAFCTFTTGAHTMLGETFYHRPLHPRASWFILFYHVWESTWIKIHWNSIWLRAWSHTASHYTWGSWPHYMILEVVLGTAIGHFLLGSHNFMVTALGLCVKWPLHCSSVSRWKTNHGHRSQDVPGCPQKIEHRKRHQMINCQL